MPTLVKRTINTLAKAWKRTPLTPEQQAELELHREWDRQLAMAISDRDRLEIDAIFSRADISITK